MAKSAAKQDSQKLIFHKNPRIQLQYNL